MISKAFVCLKCLCMVLSSLLPLDFTSAAIPIGLSIVSSRRLWRGSRHFCPLGVRSLANTTRIGLASLFVEKQPTLIQVLLRDCARAWARLSNSTKPNPLCLPSLCDMKESRRRPNLRILAQVRLHHTYPEDSQRRDTRQESRFLHACVSSCHLQNWYWQSALNFWPRHAPSSGMWLLIWTLPCCLSSLCVFIVRHAIRYLWQCV